MKKIQAVSREDWLIAPKEFLKKEKEFTYAREKLSEERRKLPMVNVATDYVFDSNNGKVSLSSIFGEYQQLIIYHFMYGRDWEQGCPSCSYWADNFNGIDKHLNARDTAFAVTSNAPLKVLNTYKDRFSWKFNWLSGSDNNFGKDFGVTFDEGNNQSMYNYSDETPEGEMPGISVFFKQGDEIFHSYSTYARGLDMLNGA